MTFGMTSKERAVGYYRMNYGGDGGPNIAGSRTSEGCMPHGSTAAVIASMAPLGKVCDSLENVRKEDSCNAVASDEVRERINNANL